MKPSRSYRRFGVTLLFALLSLSTVLLYPQSAAADHDCITSADRDFYADLGVLFPGEFCPTHTGSVTWDRNALWEPGVLYPREFYATHSALLTVSDQLLVDGHVTIDSVFSNGPGYVVVYGDYQAAPAPALGHAWVAAGWSYNVQVQIDTSRKLSTVYAMLHGDSGQVGVYEFGMAWGADAPALVDGRPIITAFRVD